MQLLASNVIYTPRLEIQMGNPNLKLLMQRFGLFGRSLLSIVTVAITE